MVGKHQEHIDKEVHETNSGSQACKCCKLPLAMAGQVALSKESARNLTTDSEKEQLISKRNLRLPFLRQWSLKVCVTVSSVSVFWPERPGHWVHGVRGCGVH